MEMMKGPYTTWYDKVPGKTVKWKEKDWKKQDTVIVLKWSCQKRSVHSKKRSFNA